MDGWRSLPSSSRREAPASQALVFAAASAIAEADYRIAEADYRREGSFAA